MLKPRYPGAFSNGGSHPGLESCLVGVLCVLWGGGQASILASLAHTCPFIILQQQ